MYKKTALKLLAISSVAAVFVGALCIGYMQLETSGLTDLQASTNPVSTWSGAEDNEAPKLTLLREVVRTSDLKSLDAHDFMRIEDVSESKTRIGDYKKLSDLTEMTCDVTAKFRQQMEEESVSISGMDLKNSEVTMQMDEIPTVEGIYSADVYAWDTSGNQSVKKILIIFDRSGPTISHEPTEESMEVDDVNQTPVVTISEGQIQDAVDGVLSSRWGSVDVALSDEVNHVYTVTITARDYGRNTTTITYPLTLVQKPQEISVETEDSEEVDTTPSKSGGGKPKTNTVEKTESTAPDTKTDTAATTGVDAPVETSISAPVITGSYNDGMASEVLTILNQRREEVGLSPLSLSGTLSAAARTRAVEITESFSHTRPNGASPSSAVLEAGGTYSVMGENIAAGQASASSVMEAWMASPSHAANILDGSYGQVGIACYVDSAHPYKYYWVQIFTN